MDAEFDVVLGRLPDYAYSKKLVYVEELLERATSESCENGFESLLEAVRFSKTIPVLRAFVCVTGSLMGHVFLVWWFSVYLVPTITFISAALMAWPPQARRRRRRLRLRLRLQVCANDISQMRRARLTLVSKQGLSW